MSSRSALSGIFWNGAESFFLQMIQLLVSMVLARLLTAVDFGLIALISVFIAIADTITQGGFRATIIMRPELKEIDYSTAFIYNLAVSALLYLIMYFSAPLIANYYNEPKLVLLVRVLGIVNIIHAGYFVQDALLQKNMRFKLLALRNIMASLISGGVAIGMAFSGFGVWSLVWLTISRAVVINVFLWTRSVWKFTLQFSYASFRKNFSFGYRMMVTNITGVVFGNLNNLLIGKYYTKADLGYYYQARKLTIPSESVTGVLTKTSTPLLSRNQTDLGELHRSYFQLIRIAALCIIPLVTLMFVLSRDIIVVLFTVKWLDSVPIFRIIILGGMFAPFIIMNGQTPAIMGDSRFYLRLDTFFKVLFLLLCFITIRFGLYVFIASQTAFTMFRMAVNSYVARKYIKVGLRAQLKVYQPYFIFSAIAGSISYLLLRLVDSMPIIALPLGTIAFLVVFAAQVYFFERKTFSEASRLIRAGIGKVRGKNDVVSG